jgi:hypothetical protein
VVRWFEATKTTGTAPECPPVQQCDGFPTDNDNGLFNPDDHDIWGSGTCAFGNAGGAPAALGGLVIAAALAVSRRRRRR